MTISIKNLKLKYQNKIALNNIFLNIENNKIYSIIGKSGSGKSSLLRSIAHLEKYSGEILFDGESVSENLYPSLTMVFQNLFLYPHLSIIENFKLAATKLNNNLDADIIELSEKLGIKELLNKFPNQLSGGQKQRAAIIRALVLKPKYLLLDEITSSLDIENAAIIANFLKEIKHNTTIIISTHSLRLAKHISDEIIYLENGEIKELGENIINEPKTKELKDFLDVLSYF